MKKVFMFVIAALLAIGAATGTRAQIVVEGDSALLWKTLPYQHGVTGEILNAVYSPDETKIIVTTTEKWCELDAETGAFIRMLPDNIRGLAKFTENGEYFISYALQKVRYADLQVLGQYKMPENNKSWKFKGFDVNDKANVVIAYILHAAHQPTYDTSLFVYDYTTFELKKKTGITGNYMFDVKISPTGEYFLTQSEYDPDLSTNSENRWVCTQWDLKTLEPIKEVPQLELPTAFIELLKFSNDGSKLACASDSKVDIYNENLELIDSYFLNRHERIGLDFSLDSKFLTAGEMWEGGMVNSVCLLNLEKRLVSYKYLFNLDKMAVHRVHLNKHTKRILSSSSLNVSMIKISTTSTTEPQEGEILTPNPTNGIISFELNNFEGNLKIIVSDSRGKEILSQERFSALNQRITLNLTEFVSGVYFINCYDLDKGSLIKTLKLIKE